MDKIPPLYYARLTVEIVLLFLVWRDEHWPLALLVTITAISIETSRARHRQMIKFIMMRAKMPPPSTGGPHVPRSQADEKQS